MRTPLEVAGIFRAADPAYWVSHAGHLSLHQLKVMSAIEHCRTAALGGHVEACARIDDVEGLFVPFTSVKSAWETMVEKLGWPTDGEGGWSSSDGRSPSS